MELATIEGGGRGRWIGRTAEGDRWVGGVFFFSSLLVHNYRWYCEAYIQIFFLGQ